MDKRERRRSPRVRLDCKVKVESIFGTMNGRGRDLSDGGIGVYLAKLPPVDSTVTIRFAVPGSTIDVEATGEVRYHDRGGPGVGDDWVGVKFVRMDAPCQQAIHKYVMANYDPAADNGPPIATDD
ncbi:MAG: PilZ domain-containing protein [Deltaproteobacteria bacterium]|nr:PilZ domain-containing protein [Deltaproteobacteria bacterium]